MLICLFVCLCWGLTSQSTIFQSCRDGATASWVIYQYFWGVKCLAQGHNTAAVGFEPLTSRSGVWHSTTEPPRSHADLCLCCSHIAKTGFHMTWLILIQLNILTYHKNTLNSDTRKNYYCHPKIWWRWLYHTLMCSKYADRMTDSVDFDHTAPSGGVWSDLVLYCLPWPVCPKLSYLTYKLQWQRWARESSLSGRHP